MTLQFWQGWPRGNRIHFLVFLSVFVASLIYMWVAYFVEPAPAIELHTISEAEIDEIAVDQFKKGPFDFTVKGNNYVILQRQLGTMLKTNNVFAYSYLFVLAVFMIGMLAVISTLGKFYYILCMGIFMFFITTLSPEVLGLPGMPGQTFTVVILMMYGLTSFWFFYFAVGTSFTKRILAFTAVTVVLWAVINFFATTEAPFLHISMYGVKAGLIACAIFIVTVSHEIVAAFVYAITQNPSGRKSLNHFLLISVIYIINLGLAYAVRFGYIKWHVITIDLFLLLTISSVLGIWGIRQRQKTYEGVIDADPYAVFAFLLTGALTFTAIAMFMLNANDTALASILDITIFAHIGFGFIFLTYVFSNFAGMLAQNFQVYKVLYQPNNMPYFTFRFAGLITLAALAIYNTWQVPVNNAISGYYNGLADMYENIDNTTVSKIYYEVARTRGYRGHHANYALANIEGKQFNANEENQFYEAASGPRPTQMSVLNLSQTYQSANDNLQAIVTLKEGIRKLRQHDALENTLGLLYAKTGLPDSALKYLSDSKVSSSNLIGLAAMRRVLISDTSSELSSNPVMKANQLALMNLQKKTVTIKYELPEDTVLTLADAATISNYLVNSRGGDDTTFVRKVMSLARKPSNDGFKEAIMFAASIYLYNSGETKEAFTTLEEVTVTSQRQGKYNNTLSMWALENDEPQRAVSYAEYAVKQDYAPAKLTHAVALTEARRLNEARVEWDSLRSSGDSVLAVQLYNSLSKSFRNDEELYGYARYVLTASDSNVLPALHFSDENLKAKTILEFAQKNYMLDKPAVSINYLQQIAGMELTDPSIGSQMQILELLARIRLGEKLTNNPADFKGKDKKYKVYFDALAAEAAGDSSKANIYYKWLGNANPYFDDGVIAAANYFKGKGHTSYNMLAEALLYHPSSTRIRKAYALEAARQGFASYANNALDALKGSISASDHAALTKQVETYLSSGEQ
ncbi:MAG: hypothetical protein WDO14_04290 [Bacteroidota bacterium]